MVVALGRFDGVLRAAAEHLARTVPAKLVVIEPSAPGRPLEPPGEPHGDRLVYAVDPADGARLAAILAEAESRLGPVRGVLVGELDGTEPVPRACLAALEASENDRRFAAVRDRQGALRAALGDRDLELCLRLLSRDPLAAGAGLGLSAALDRTAEALAGEEERAGGPQWASLSWIAAAGTAEDGAGVADLDAGTALDQLLAYGLAARFIASPLDPWTMLARLASPQPAPGPVMEEAGGPAGRPGERHARPKLRNPYAAPASDLERALTEMWQDLLGIDRVGVHDSFFDLGGDSLLGAQVLARVRQRFGVDMPLAGFFELPTPAGLAGRIEAARPAAEAELESARLESMLARLEGLTPAEVERMLTERGAS